MARPVTPDIPVARISMRRLLSLDVEILSPGHRAPLTHNVRALCEQMARTLDAGEPWPFFG